MTRIRAYFLFILMLCRLAMGAESSLPEPSEKFFGLSVGLKFLSNINRRGATLYDSYQVNPVVYVGLWNHRVQIFPNSIEYVDFLWDKKLRGRTRFHLVSDRPLFVNKGEPLSFRNARDSSVEWMNTLEYFYPHYDDFWIGAEVRVAQDIIRNGGTYFEIMPKISVAQLWRHPNGKPLVQPTLYVSLGFGTSSHNRYVYGTGADTTSFNNLGYGILILLPSRVDPYYGFIQIGGYHILGASNQAGSLVFDKTSGFHANLVLSQKVM